MLLFNFSKNTDLPPPIRISKHPMLLFNVECFQVKIAEPLISKHPMLLFNFDVLLICSLTSEFQNILCYCLTKQQISRLYFIKISKHPMLLFNHQRHNRLHCAKPISKHPMLLFNQDFYTVIDKKVKFQNILCYCLTCFEFLLLCLLVISKHPMLLFNQRI